MKEVKLNVNEVVKNKNSKIFRVLEQKGNYTMLKCLDKNIFGSIEYVVAFVIKQDENGLIEWNQGRYYTALTEAYEYYNKKVS